MNLQSYLDEMGVRYNLSYHPAAYTAQDLAAAEHVPGRMVIKPVVVEVDGKYMLCVLPAPYKIDMKELKAQLDATEVKIAPEHQLAGLFPDCQLGAEPPIGRIYGLPTLIDESLLQDDRVTFQAGTHDAAVTMSLADYRRLAQAEVAHFGRQMT
jgi:Ala-tRNA(Pro) deacylase